MECDLNPGAPGNEAGSCYNLNYPLLIGLCLLTLQSSFLSQRVDSVAH